MGERLVRLLRIALGVAVVAWVVVALWRNWSDLRSQPIAWSVHPGGLAASALIVWAMYALLIAAWRSMLGGWGERLGAWDAARIWTVSSLGKYVPGKVWAIAGMAMMAREAGVAPWAATGSAIILQVLAIGTGAVVAGGLGSEALEASHPGTRVALWALAILSAGGIALLLWRPVAQRLVGAMVRQSVSGTPKRGPVLFGVVANLVAWTGYGVALWVLARSTLPESPLSLPAAIGSFAASYVAGLIFLLAPGGLGVREGVFVLMLQGALGWGGAGALALASRLLLTVTEVGAAVPFLILRRGNSRVTA